MTDIEILPDGIVALLNEGDSLVVLDEAASRVVNAAQGLTRRGPNPRFGHIADRYFTQRAQPSDIGGIAAACNGSPVFHMLEFGTIHNPPERPFFRGAVASGLVVEALSK